ncbi:hypothetical protein L195_g009143 [Trifolium pratense]|uniref:Uncharacterized protein n=1 Tax=Trifolium pratense TaxID=57577 RepID=A0A2K3PB46_TRIPR|nr:hypothetical protein L195_g009143 [Trifolium pratense]
MAYQNRNHDNYDYGWGHIHEVYEPIAHPRHHHQKHHVATYEVPIAEADQSCYVKKTRREIETNRQGTKFGYQNGTTYESIDQEAEAFIQHEHRRMELAKLMSSLKAP